MLRQFLRIAFRNLAKQKVLTVINLSGLSLGLACFSLILLFAVSEFNYDSWHEKAARIYRVNEVFTLDNGRRGGRCRAWNACGTCVPERLSRC